MTTDNATPGPGADILLVDDEPANLLTLEAILHDLGQNLVKARSGADALRFLLARDFAAILLDVQMRPLDGFETAKLIRARKKSRHTPILFLTAYEDNRLSVEEAYALGAVDYLVKPVVPVVLRAKVNGFIELFEKRRQIEAQAERLRQLDRREFEQKLAEENARLSAAERRFRALTENSSDAVCLLAPDAAIRYVSPPITRILGYAPEELVGQSGLGLVHAEEQGLLATRLAALVARPGGTDTVQVRARHRDGSWVWVEAVGTNLLDEPAIGAVVVNFRDVTERRRTVQQLRERAEEMERFMDVLPVAVFIARDPECRRVTGNRAAYELLRMPPDSNISQTAPPEERPPFQLYRNGTLVPPDELPLQRAVRTAAEVRDVDLDVVFADGTSTPIYGYATPLFDEAGQVRGALAAFMDISERKSLEKALQERAARLAEADRRKDEFLAMLAHELRNPLAPVRNALHILGLPGVEAAAAAQAREMVQRQVQNMVRLVDDLLDVSRITRGKIRLRAEPVDLAVVVGRAVESARPLIDANRHTLTVSLPDEPLPLTADPTRLEQVFANLLNNAAKYTERGGAIRLEAERQGGEVVVRVRDTGFGIPPQVLPHVFDLFTQADRTLDRAQGGLGIGLTLVKRLVEMHRGSVAAHSEGAGKGSEFVVRLPLAARAVGREGSRGREPAAAAPAGPGHCRVLVVDDNKDAADSLAMLLRVWGHEVRTSHDGQSALKAARSYRPDIVLLDIGLPGLDGYEVAAELRKEFGEGEMLLVALTGYGQDEDRSRSARAGFNQHWVKPVDPEALQALLAARGQAAK